jgi:Bacterial Ig-like domain (group 1)/Domain of unknown function DUF11/Putative Ig domain
VPANVHVIDAYAVGSSGSAWLMGNAGRGARATATLAVSPGQQLRICVNTGGGVAGLQNGGGGASGIAAGDDFSTPLLIGGGGGAAGYWVAPGGSGGPYGGDAGTPIGQDGVSDRGVSGGRGGGLTPPDASERAPGAATTASGPGVGGDGTFESTQPFVAVGGAGGGGYYGGGGGSGALGVSGAGGGGGGSSFCASDRSDVSGCAFRSELFSSWGAGAGQGYAKVVLSYVDQDLTPPVITPVVAGTLGENGWHTSAVQVTWLVSDLESTISAQTGCDAAVIGDDTAGTLLTCEATSEGGTTSLPVTVKVDTTPPALTIDGGPQDGETYEVGSVPAAPTCAAEDATSGLDGDCSTSGYSSAVGAHELTFSAEDQAGNTATKTVSYLVADSTPPVVEPTIVGTEGSNGWYTSNVTVSWSVREDESSILDVAGCGDSAVMADTTGRTFSCEVVAESGTTARSLTIARDATPPVLTIDGGPVEGASYAVGDVPDAPSCMADDATSGVDGECFVDGYSAEVGDHELTVSALDLAGNEASQTIRYSVGDPSPPVIQGTPIGTLGENGWYVSDVDVSWTVNDPESFVGGRAGCDASVVSQDTTGMDLICTASSSGGLASSTVTLKRDATAPVITVAGGPAAGGSYPLGGVPAAPTCAATDATSGTDGGCTVAGYSVALGAHTLTFTAKDNAGNTATKTVSYSVAGQTATIAGVAPSTTTAGAAYSYTYALGGNPAPTTRLRSGALPPGITLSTDGKLRGTPTVAGTYVFRVLSSNAAGSAVSASQTITVAAAPAAELVVTGGDAQAARPGDRFAKPLSVFVTDAYGNPIGRQQVTFTVSWNGANLGGASSRTLTTGADGLAALTLTARSTGVARVTATLAGNASVPAVVFTEAMVSTGAARADVTVSMPYLPASVKVGSITTVMIKVKNNGPDSASSVITTLDPGASVKIISLTSGGVLTALGTSAQWPVKTISPGATVTYYAKLLAISKPWSGSSPIRLAAISSTVDPVLANNAIRPQLKITAP